MSEWKGLVVGTRAMVQRRDIARLYIIILGVTSCSAFLSLPYIVEAIPNRPKLVIIFSARLNNSGTT